MCIRDRVGTMGIEAYFDKQLAGKDGYREAFVDAENYQLPCLLYTSSKE